MNSLVHGSIRTVACPTCTHIRSADDSKARGGFLLYTSYLLGALFTHIIWALSSLRHILFSACRKGGCSPLHVIYAASQPVVNPLSRTATRTWQFKVQLWLLCTCSLLTLYFCHKVCSPLTLSRDSSPRLGQKTFRDSWLSSQCLFTSVWQELLGQST